MVTSPSAHTQRTPRAAHDAGQKRDAGGAERGGRERGERGERGAFVPFSHWRGRRNRQAQAHTRSLAEECNGNHTLGGVSAE